MINSRSPSTTMKYEEIQDLLDRYWEGETSLQEEQQLKSYFNSGSIDERLLTVAPLFIALREEQKVQLKIKAKGAPMRPNMYLWAIAASLALLLTAGWWMFKEEPNDAPLMSQVPVQQPAPIEQALVATPEAPPLVPPRVNMPRRKIPVKNTAQPMVINAETAQAMAEIKAALSLVSAKLENGRARAVKGAVLLEAMDKLPRRKTG